MLTDQTGYDVLYLSETYSRGVPQIKIFTLNACKMYTNITYNIYSFNDTRHKKLA